MGSKWFVVPKLEPPRGSMEAILDSLRGKLLQLPDETVVHPGHGPRTSIGEERQSNPFLIQK